MFKTISEEYHHMLREDGIKEGKKEIAKAMKNEGENINKISRLSGLTTEEIKKL